MKFKFNYKKKKFEIEVEECRSFFSKFKGLMFQDESKPLLFIFKKPTRQAIHSFFCVPFIAIWFDGNEVVEAKLIKPWKYFIQPKKKFDKLLEIPSTTHFFREFLDEAKI